MRSYILFSVVCLQLGWISGVPAGVGVYSYQDSEGNRYGGTYDLDDAQFFGKHKQAAAGPTPSHVGFGNFGPFVPNFQPFDDFFPEYFSNLENLLQEVTEHAVFDSHPLEPLKFRQLSFPQFKPFAPFPPFKPFKPIEPIKPLKPLPSLFRSSNDNEDSRAFNKNLENQKLAFNAAKKAYDLTSNQAGYIPHSPGRFDSFGDFPFMSRGGNSAFASGAAGPGYSHQIAAINPENPDMRNVNIMNRFADTANGGGGGYYSVSSSSYASSSDHNGQRQAHRGAETVVNNNGQVTRYKVEN